VTTLTLTYPYVDRQAVVSPALPRYVNANVSNAKLSNPVAASSAVSASSRDEDLIEAILDGNDGAFRCLVERYQAHVTRTVTGMLGKNQEVDDCVQDVFIRLYGSLGKYRGEAQIKTYVTRIAVNRSLDLLRKRQRSFFVPWETKEVEEVESHAPGPIDNLLTADRQKQLRKALDKLAPKHRAVIVLRLIDGMSTSDTADVLGVPYGTVLSRLKRALGRLKHELGGDEYENE
jgi:RNA polymerase sigma-70 factor (ECF subfamily)